MAPQYLAEVPMYLALFLCGAVGYLATKWANKRLSASRLPPVQAKKIDLEERTGGPEEEPATQEVAATAVPPAFPSEPESEPAAVSSPARSAARRRRAVRKNGPAVAETAPAAGKEIACDQKAVAHDEAETVPMPAVEEEEDDEDDTPLEASEAPVEHEEGPERLSLGEEPSKDVGDEDTMEQPCREPSTAELPLAKEMATVPQEQQQEEVSARVARMLERKVARKERKAAEQRTRLLESAREEQEQKTLVAKIEDTLAPAACEEAEELTEESAQEKVAVTPQRPDIVDNVYAQKIDEHVAEASLEIPSDFAPMEMELVNMGADGRRFSAIISPDGQQLYTDGEEVYVMACVESSEGAGPEAAPVLHSVITDPMSPWHQVVMSLGVAEQPAPLQPIPPAGVPYFMGGDDGATAWASPAAGGPEMPWVDETSSSWSWGPGRHTSSSEDPSDALWDTCWDFAA